MLRNIQRIHHVEVFGVDKVICKVFKGRQAYEIIHLAPLPDVIVPQSSLRQPLTNSHKCCVTGDCVAVAYSQKWYPGVVVSTTPGTHTMVVRF